MIPMDVIFTDEHGRPYERPESPPEPMTVDQRIAYWRVCDAYRDRVQSGINVKFVEHFRAALRRAR